MYAQALRVTGNKALLGLSLFQIVAGALAITFGSLSLVEGCYLGDIAQGIWAGSFIVITGIVGAVAFSNETTCLVETYMWTSAFSVLLSAALVTMETVAYTFAFVDCKNQPSSCNETCLSYHRWLMAVGEFLQVVSIGAVVVAARTLKGRNDTVGVPYKKLITDV